MKARTIITLLLLVFFEIAQAQSNTDTEKIAAEFTVRTLEKNGVIKNHPEKYNLLELCACPELEKEIQRVVKKESLPHQKEVGFKSRIPTLKEELRTRALTALMLEYPGFHVFRIFWRNNVIFMITE